MSELKVYRISGIEFDSQFYHKPEADKVIAEKDKEIARLNDKALQYKVLDKEHCRDLNTQERLFALQIAHNKHKRCLAMAKFCHVSSVLCEGPDSLFYRRWFHKWYELAEEPTWAKFLQLIHKEAK